MGNNSLHCRECYNICIYHVHAANVHYINHRSNCPVFFIEYCMFASLRVSMDMDEGNL